VFFSFLKIPFVCKQNNGMQTITTFYDNSKSFPKYLGSEENFQKTIARYLDLSGLLWFHVPNEIKSNVQYGAKRKSLGVKSGVPDVCILEPRGQFNGLFLELKVKYNKPSENQIKWIELLKSKGYAAAWTRSLDEAIEVIESYMKLDK